MKKMMMVLVLLLGFEVAASGETVPSVINYQGRLTAKDGTPLNGNFMLQFTLYDDPITGSTLWQESKVVTVASGKFSHLLGSTLPITSAVFQSPNVYLGLRISGDTEMTPRSQLASVGYALKAQDSDMVDGLHANEISAGGAVVPVMYYFRHPASGVSNTQCAFVVAVPANARFVIVYESISPYITNIKFFSAAGCGTNSTLADTLGKSSVGLSFPGAQSIYWQGSISGSTLAPITINGELRY